MASLHMLGKVSRDEHPLFRDDYWFYIERVDQGGERDLVALHEGTNMLENTISMWDLIDPEKRKPYFELRRKVDNQKSDELPEGGLVTVEQINQFFDILDDLDIRLAKFLNANGRVKEEYVDFIKREDPGQILDGGYFDYRGIREKIQEIRLVKGFLQKAVELNYPLAIG